MDEQTAAQPVVRRAAKKKAANRPKALWMKIREPLAQSRVAKGVLTSMFAQALRFVKLTNPTVAGSIKLDGTYEVDEPGIVALWHGQHLLACWIRDLCQWHDFSHLYHRVAVCDFVRIRFPDLSRIGLEAIDGKLGQRPNKVFAKENQRCWREYRAKCTRTNVVELHRKRWRLSWGMLMNP